MSNRCTSTLALLLFLFTASSTAFAQAIAEGKNELSTDLIFVTSKPTEDVGGDRTSRTSWRVAYGRFITDRLAIGPLFRIVKDPGASTTGYVGGLARYHFGDLNRRWIPLVEVSSARSMNDPSGNYTDVQFLGGIMVPMGATGGRFRVGPYYYRAFYDEDETGYSNFSSFGVSWSVALLF